jgi:hypothetical protein
LFNDVLAAGLIFDKSNHAVIDFQFTTTVNEERSSKARSSFIQEAARPRFQ